MTFVFDLNSKGSNVPSCLRKMYDSILALQNDFYVIGLIHGRNLRHDA